MAGSRRVGEHPDHPRDVESHPRVVEMLRGFAGTSPADNEQPAEVNGYAVPDDRAMSLHSSRCTRRYRLSSPGLRMVQIVDLPGS
ncbi:MAG: hypothetical protein R2849_10520 [Thermomicrobiales bacterium]